MGGGGTAGAAGAGVETPAGVAAAGAGRWAEDSRSSRYSRPRQSTTTPRISSSQTRTATFMTMGVLPE